MGGMRKITTDGTFDKAWRINRLTKIRLKRPSHVESICSCAIIEVK